MTSEQTQILAMIEAVGRVPAEGPALRQFTDQLHDLGYLNIAPPGWCYSINAAGREALAQLRKPPEEAFSPELSDEVLLADSVS